MFSFILGITVLVPMVTLIPTGNARQVKRPQKNPNNKRFTEVEVQAILDGYEDAYELCQQNFKMERWNCPKPIELNNPKHPISLTAIYREANKEISYVYAMIAAGVAHNMIRACQLGKEQKCKCAEDKKNPKTGMGSALVTCGENISYGFKRAKKILRNMDYKRVKNPTRKYFNWKNAAAGMKVYRDSMPKECRCHGLSGQCSQRKCFRSTPPSLKKPSIQLKKLYSRAIKLHKESMPPSHIRNPRTASSITNDTNLVYIKDSPNYCISNPDKGIFGTLHRECKHKDKESCTKLCSSCGFRIHTFVRNVVNKKCNCKFHWCCKVTCETCKERKITSKCLPPA